MGHLTGDEVLLLMLVNQGRREDQVEREGDELRWRRDDAGAEQRWQQLRRRMRMRQRLADVRTTADAAAGAVLLLLLNQAEVQGLDANL